MKSEARKRFDSEVLEICRLARQSTEASPEGKRMLLIRMVAHQLAMEGRLADDVLDDFNSGKIGIAEMKGSLKGSEFRKSEAFKRLEVLEKGEIR